MGARDRFKDDPDVSLSGSELDELLGKSTPQEPARETIAVAELLAILDSGRVPLVALPLEGAAGIRAQTTVDLKGDDVGQSVVVLFEGGDSARPIVIGVLRTDRTSTPAELAGKVEVSADGERMILSAKRELVLRCGKANITLKHDGTVRIVGEKILSRAKAANRVQGGSVHLN